MRKKVGVLGGGQLALMLKEAANKLNLDLVCYEDKKGTSASYIAEVSIGDFKDERKISDFVESCDVVTFETENIPAETLQLLKIYSSVYPNPKTLLIAQDRQKEKEFATKLKIPTATFFPLNDEFDFNIFPSNFPFPAILKTRTGGYDGKGQIAVKNPMDLKAAWHVLDRWPSLLESKIDFEREVSLLAARNSQGEIVYYPLVENFHHKGIIRLTKAPYDNEELTQTARSYLKKMLEELDYVGLLSVEFFVDKSGKLIFNEMAPRVHNSGHWTLDGANVGQFEQHLRAICGMPLIKPEVLKPTIMVNWVGEFGYNKFNNASLNPDDYQIVHFDYKKSPLPNRKLGHSNIVLSKQNMLDQLYSDLVKDLL